MIGNEMIGSEAGMMPERLSEKIFAAIVAGIEKEVADGGLSRERADAMLVAAGKHVDPKLTTVLVA